MAIKYLKPMLDNGSARVFNCNALTRQVLRKEPQAAQFFRNRALNDVIFIKDSVPESERKGFRVPPVGTKIFFPFNENDIYEGGRTMFLHDPQLPQTLVANFGRSAALSDESLGEDLRVLEVLDALPSLDPFLMKDVFIRSGIAVNDAYFEISPEQWREIQTFILQRFEPLVKAAFPEAMSSDQKATQLVEKIWEAKDTAALAPLIEAFRLPADKATEIFAAWKGINFYSFQYSRVQPQLIEMAKWLKDVDVPSGAMPMDERARFVSTMDQIREQLRREWQSVETILREYMNSYDQMFKYKTHSGQFLEFLRSCRHAYWNLGSGLGKVGHAAYCWQILTSRFPSRKLPVKLVDQTVRTLGEILRAESKTAKSVAWA